MANKDIRYPRRPLEVTTMESLKDQFIISDDVDEKRLKQFVERLLPFCKVTESGKVIIGKGKLTVSEKIGIVLVARYLANRLSPTILPEMGAEDLSDNLLVPRDQILARIKNLKDGKLVRSSSRGVYGVDPTRIGSFLKELERKRKESK